MPKSTRTPNHARLHPLTAHKRTLALIPAICAVAAMINLFAIPARAATVTWDPSLTGTASDGSGTWSTGVADWGSGTDAVWATGNDAVIGNGGTAGTITVSGGVSVDSITFNPVTSGTYTLSGGTITLTGTNINVNAAGATIGSALTAASGIVKNGAGLLDLTANDNFGSGITVQGGTAEIDMTSYSNNTPGNYTALNFGAVTLSSTATIQLNNTASYADADYLTGGTFSGAGTILKTGTGYLRIASSATALSGFTGTINVQAGMLGINAGATVSATAATLNIGSAGTFDIRTGGLVVNQLTGSGTMECTASGGAISVGNNNGSSTFSGVIQPSGSVAMSLTKNGTGTFTLTGPNNYTGGTTINAGTLQIAGSGVLATSGTYAGAITDNGTFVYNSSANQTLTASVTGTGSLIEAGPGTEMFTAPLSSSLSFVVTGGTMEMNYGTNNIFNGSAVTVGAGGTFLNAGNAITMGTITLTGGILSGSNSEATYGSYFFNGPVNVSGGTQSTINANWINPGNQTFTVGAGSTLAISSVTLTSGFTEAGAGTIVLTGSTISGQTVAVSGSSTLQIGNGTTDGYWSGPITDSGSLVYNIIGTQASSAAITGTGTLTKTGGGTVSLSGNGNTYSGGTTITSGTLELDLSGRSGGLSIPSPNSIGSAGTVVINSNSTFGIESEYSSNISVSGSGTLIKTGSGDFEFDGSGASIKSFAGQINILNGILGSNSSDWGSSAGLMNVYIASGAYFDLREGNVVLNQLTGTGTIGSSYTTSVVLSAGNNNGSSTFAGSIINSLSSIPSASAGGVLNLVKNGTGTEILTGSSNYTGATTVNGGTLQIGGAGDLSNTASITMTGATFELGGTGLLGTSGTYGGTVTDNGAFVYNSSANQTLSTVVSGTGSLTQSGPGTLTLAGGDTYSGATTVTSGTLVIQVQATGSRSSITTASGAVTVFQQTANLPQFWNSANVIIQGAGDFVKTGAFSLYCDGGSGRQFIVAQSAGALFDLQAGTIQQGGTPNSGFESANLGSLNVASGATLDLYAQSATVDALTGSGTVTNGLGTFGTLTIGAANDTSSANNPYFSGNTATFSGVISGGADLALTKVGTGTQVLSGSGTYTGATTVSAGTLIVSGSLTGTVSASVASAGTLEVDGLLNNSATTTLAGTLDGTGSVGAITAHGGAVAPGLTAANSTTTSGVLTANGAVTLSGSTNFDIRLGVLSSGTDSDELASAGAVTLNDAILQLTLGSGMANLTPANINHLFYVLISGGAGSTGTGTDVFSGLAQGATVNAGGGFTFTIEYAENATGTGSGSDVGLELTAVPEPGTWGMLLAGTAMLIGLQRRRRM